MRWPGAAPSGENKKRGRKFLYRKVEKALPLALFSAFQPFYWQSVEFLYIIYNLYIYIYIQFCIGDWRGILQICGEKKIPPADEEEVKQGGIFEKVIWLEGWQVEFFFVCTVGRQYYLEFCQLIGHCQWKLGLEVMTQIKVRYSSSYKREKIFCVLLA